MTFNIDILDLVSINIKQGYGVKDCIANLSDSVLNWVKRSFDPIQNFRG